MEKMMEKKYWREKPNKTLRIEVVQRRRRRRRWEIIAEYEEGRRGIKREKEESESESERKRKIEV